MFKPPLLLRFACSPLLNLPPFFPPPGVSVFEIYIKGAHWRAVGRSGSTESKVYIRRGVKKRYGVLVFHSFMTSFLCVFMQVYDVVDRFLLLFCLFSFFFSYQRRWIHFRPVQRLKSRGPFLH